MIRLNKPLPNTDFIRNNISFLTTLASYFLAN